MVKLDYNQARKVHKLIRKECCNCVENNCVLMDDVCVQLISQHNDFIRDAIDFYCEYLRCPESVKFLTPALESVISGKIRDTENRLSHLQFKTAVAIEKLYLLLGDEFEKSDDDFDEYREAAVLNVKQTNGSSRY